ncbi:MAG TPA: hypothetical protein VMH23_15865 [Bacteroidota bacterium]|nr:hypothetical protein [Bacteroidota bacterium]
MRTRFIGLAFVFVTLCPFALAQLRDMSITDITTDGHGIASGVYIYRLAAGQFAAVRTMALVK